MRREPVPRPLRADGVRRRIPGLDLFHQVEQVVRDHLRAVRAQMSGQRQQALQHLPPHLRDVPRAAHSSSRGVNRALT
ncbi:hypothetical protein [Streptomyces sp. NPDC126499]|uniref:hypothetical protein n=1 Tax=Streptomyces sp. NPDC126499 TaxID=3155314 RepID=UPI00387E60AD